MQLAASKKTGNWLWDTLRSPDVSLMPSGAILAAPLKIGTKVLIAGSAVAATAAYSYFQKNGIGQDQKQKATTGDFIINAEPGSTVRIDKPTTGSIDQSQAATATQLETGGIMSILMIAAVIVVLMMFKK
jgi:hypothetical protein